MKGVLIIIMSFTIGLMFPLIFTSCNEDQEKDNQVIIDIPKSAHADTILDLTEQQKVAFDALNTLQTSTDERNRLYSTFAGIPQPCYPPDTSFTITQSDLATVLEQFVSKHCKYMPIKKRNELARTAALAQKEYTVLYCPDNSSELTDESTFPITGTWVMPNILGQRDVLIVW